MTMLLPLLLICTWAVIGYSEPAWQPVATLMMLAWVGVVVTGMRR
jgi:hypothetical protein